MTKHLGKLKEKQVTGILVSKTTWTHVEFVPENYLVEESSKNRNKINISLLQQTCEFRRSTVGISNSSKDQLAGIKCGCKIKLERVSDWIGLRALSLDKSLRKFTSIGQPTLHHCGH